MEELGADKRECADLLQMIKDPRIGPEIVNELTKVLDGEMRASGALLAALTALVRMHRRAVLRNASLVWNEDADRRIRATTDDGYKITIVPQSRRRWQCFIRDPRGWALTARIWLRDLETAKIKALMEIQGDPDSDFELGRALE